MAPASRVAPVPEMEDQRETEGRPRVETVHRVRRPVLRRVRSEKTPNSVGLRPAAASGATPASRVPPHAAVLAEAPQRLDGGLPCLRRLARAPADNQLPAQPLDIRVRYRRQFDIVAGRPDGAETAPRPRPHSAEARPPAQGFDRAFSLSTGDVPLETQDQSKLISRIQQYRIVSRFPNQRVSGDFQIVCGFQLSLCWRSSLDPQRHPAGAGAAAGDTAPKVGFGGEQSGGIPARAVEQAPPEPQLPAQGAGAYRHVAVDLAGRHAAAEHRRDQLATDCRCPPGRCGGTRRLHDLLRALRSYVRVRSPHAGELPASLDHGRQVCRHPKNPSSAARSACSSEAGSRSIER